MQAKMGGPSLLEKGMFQDIKVESGRSKTKSLGVDCPAL